MSETLAVDVAGVSKSFGSVRAVVDLSLQVAPGEVYGVLGPNGAGKTTMLRMLFGLIRPDAGRISLFGRTWEQHDVGALDGVAGFIESPRFYPYLTGRQNLDGLARLDGAGGTALVEEVLDTVELADRADRKVGGYSYGMKRRLGVAASLLRQPRLLVLDEPANGLDPAGIRDMRALVSRLAAGGLTVLLSSHHMDEVEEICDNVTIMSRGSVVFHGGIGDLRSMAPDPGRLLRTTADEEAFALAPLHPRLVVVPTDDGLRVTGPEGIVTTYVAALVRSGIGIRAFIPSETPLEALFFMLTDDNASRALVPEVAAR